MRQASVTLGACSRAAPRTSASSDADVLVRRYAGACPGLRLDSPPAILHEVPMRLIGLILAFALTVLPHVADGQSTGRIPRLCFLTFDPGTPQSPSPRFEGFFAGLRDLG